MDWKDEAKKELRNYKALKESCSNIPLRIRSIRDKKTSIRSSSDAVPVQGGGNKYEDHLLDLIVEEERLKYLLKANRLRVQLIERGLSVLSENERLIITTFSSHRSGEAVDLLSASLCLERAQIYRLWEAALYHYVIAEYGLPEF